MERPAGVTVLAIFEMVVAVAMMIVGVLAFGVGSAVAMRSAAYGGAFSGAMGAFGATAGLILLVLGVLLLVAAIGVLKLQDWARMLTLVLTGLAGLVHVIRLMRYILSFRPIHAFLNVIDIGICVLIIWYLFQPEVKRAFGAS